MNLDLWLDPVIESILQPAQCRPHKGLGEIYQFLNNLSGVIISYLTSPGWSGMMNTGWKSKMKTPGLCLQMYKNNVTRGHRGKFITSYIRKGKYRPATTTSTTNTAAAAPFRSGYPSQDSETGWTEEIFKYQRYWPIWQSYVNPNTELWLNITRKCRVRPCLCYRLPHQLPSQESSNS